MRALILTMLALPVAAAPPATANAKRARAATPGLAGAQGADATRADSGLDGGRRVKSSDAGGTLRADAGDDAGRADDAGAADAGEPRGGVGTGPFGAMAKSCTLEGVVSFHTPSDVTIDHVVVYVSRGQAAGRAPPQAHAIAQLNQKFVPEVLVIQKNDSVSFPNRDRIEHSVFSTDGTVHIPASTKADPEPVAFARAGSFRIQCNIHSNMRTDVLVVPVRQLHTFVGRDGRWRIDGLTAPQVTVTAWEPNGGEVTQVVSPCDGRPVELRLEGQRAPLPLRKDGSLYKDYAP